MHYFLLAVVECNVLFILINNYRSLMLLHCFFFCVTWDKSRCTSLSTFIKPLLNIWNSHHKKQHICLISAGSWVLNLNVFSITVSLKLFSRSMNHISGQLGFHCGRGCFSLNFPQTEVPNNFRISKDATWSSQNDVEKCYHILFNVFRRTKFK